jgi:hypothetical protein
MVNHIAADLRIPIPSDWVTLYAAKLLGSDGKPIGSLRLALDL